MDHRITGKGASLLRNGDSSIKRVLKSSLSKKNVRTDILTKLSHDIILIL